MFISSITYIKYFEYIIATYFITCLYRLTIFICIFLIFYNRILIGWIGLYYMDMHVLFHHFPIKIYWVFFSPLIVIDALRNIVIDKTFHTLLIVSTFKG